LGDQQNHIRCTNPNLEREHTMNQLVPTPIVNRLGIATTVHKSVKPSVTSVRTIPAPSAPKAQPDRTPEQIVKHWAHDHMGNDIAAWVTGFIREPYVENINGALTDLNRWDIEGAVNYVESTLTDLATYGTLDEHDSVASVFGDSSDVPEYEKLHAALIDGYYVDPVSAWGMLYA
jgi:hypothetical protein